MNKQSFITLAVILLLASANPLTAQRFTGGFTAGLAASQVDGDTYSGYNKAGVIAGGWANVLLSDHSAFHAGLTYIQKGSRHNPDPEKGDYQQLLIRLGYVEMPLLYQYRLKNGLYLEGGGSLGVLLHSYSEIDLLETTHLNPFRLLDLSLQLGIGYQFSEKWKVNLRNGNSLGSIRKQRVTGDQWRIWGYGQYNHVLALELMYIL